MVKLKRAKVFFEILIDFIDSEISAINHVYAYKSPGWNSIKNKVDKLCCEAHASSASEYGARSNNVVLCRYCNSKLHRIYKCSEFIVLSSGTRLKFVKERSLCFNCFSNEHRFSTVQINTDALNEVVRKSTIHYIMTLWSL